MPDQESTQSFIRITYYQGLLIAGGFTLLGGFIGAWLNHYFAGQRNNAERYNSAYDKFAEAFTPALHRLDDPKDMLHDIIREEFPRHKDAFFTFEHMVRGGKGESRFKEKWKEYEIKRERIYKYIWGDDPITDFPELLEPDGVTIKNLTEELKRLINELLKIAKI
ncbi:MAG: hypothetical protein OEW48_14430 [Phycisphaerae bacterium]|nr:hypothetical protein [Phycisphaerae bacterium]